MQTKILMVCLGNICRSPLAEGILKSKIDSSKVFVDSAGTGHWHVGDEPDQRSIAVGKKYNIDITHQRGRQFSTKDFEDFDLIYVMDNSNKENVLALAQNDSHREKVKLILDEIFPGENVDVPDPYFGGNAGFENVFQMLDKACDEIAKRL
ncbi:MULTISPECIES: low molecular weight protein-tyrosine-phosphatase [Aequorivita]|uniref:protein-tyrosine-phosphatase n=1 Tax=Aequorivita iocasae TaxID=2803865 RepID=A0ABX7DRG3_9FLAO|nr:MULTISPECIES: low molecular weight protein-tyrosine-phosphatase [Aequorivita]QQX76694.1 low molecular weight phosphotyrosine protein phosphatase [Aequorivita iocasae]UCA56166.1 low molecular weight phosphotyrosine protein phosphatase [Aequorivita sp. F7]